MIIQQAECYKSFNESWGSRWAPSILKIAKADGVKYQEDDEQGIESMDELPQGCIHPELYKPCVHTVHFFHRIYCTSSI